MNNFTYIDPQIQKATSRVQITLPAETRDITVFDAIRDNKGKRRRFRIIFHWENGAPVIDSIRLRNERTYKNLWKNEK